MKHYTKLCAVMAALLILTACTAPKSPAPNGEAALTPITVVLDWTPNTNHTGLYAALENGYYAENGLAVSIIQPPEDGALVLLASGHAQLGISFQDWMAMALTADEPLPVTAIAAILQHNDSGMLSLKEKGITSPKGLEGKAYATWDLPIEQAMIRSVMQRDGGDYDRLRLIHSTVTDVLTALSTDVDAVWVYYSWDGIAAEVKGLDTHYFAFGEMEPELDFYTPVIAASDEYLASSPETVKAFLDATARGYEYAIEQPEEAAEILLKHAPELDAEIVHQSQQYLAARYRADAAQWGLFDAARWDRFYDWLWENALIPTKIEAGKGFTNAFLPQ